MRISINLATRPFVELRPLFARLRLAMAGLAVLAVGLGAGVHAMKGRAQVGEAQMGDLKARTSAVENERKANETRMMQPQNQAVLVQSRFLNGLFASKSFSWTSVMMDLENVLPAGVQVTSIEPMISPNGDVNIHLRVSGPRELQVDLVRNLERSQRFLLPRVSNETAQTEDQGRLVMTSGMGVPGGVQFDIVSGYNPLPAVAKGPEQKEPAENGKGNEGRRATDEGTAADHTFRGAVPAKRPAVVGAKKKHGVSGGAR